MKMLILRGLPASGKSTWAKDYARNNKDWIIVSRDDLRNMRGVYWIPKQEGLITKMEINSIKTVLDSGYNVISDGTNLCKERNRERVKMLKNIYPNLSVEYRNFDISLEDAIDRDLRRKKSVGRKVIIDMYDKYFLSEKEYYKPNNDLPEAVIVDVDGTIAKMNRRGPYDWDKVDSDIPVLNVIDLVKNIKNSGKQIIFLTGRDGNEVCKDKTIKWIENHFNWNYQNDFILYIRKENDNRKDSIIKKELFNEKIRNNFNIKMVLDDRDQVVRMWRKELGLTCLQVNYGDF